MGKAKIYCEPVFMHGTGLGNRLFIWAHCALFARDNQALMLAPNWAHLRRGAFFRGGIEYSKFLRKTLLLDNFARPRQLSRLHTLFIRMNCRKIKAADQFVIDLPSKIECTLVEFGSATPGRFDMLAGEHNYIDFALRSITKKKWLEEAEVGSSTIIGINVRLGRDFSVAQAPEDFITRGCLLTPLDWYVDLLERIRRIVGLVPVLVVSDGSAADLRPLLRLPNVRLFNGRSAISDLFALSSCRFLIGSGGSSFSAWAAFLGQRPIVTHAGQSLSWFGLDQAAPFVGTYPGADVEELAGFIRDQA